MSLFIGGFSCKESMQASVYGIYAVFATIILCHHIKGKKMSRHWLIVGKYKLNNDTNSVCVTKMVNRTMS